MKIKKDIKKILESDLIKKMFILYHDMYGIDEESFKKSITEIYKKEKQNKNKGDKVLLPLLESKIILSTVGAGVTKSIFYIKKKKIINWNNQLNRFIMIRILALTFIFLKKIKKLSKFF